MSDPSRFSAADQQGAGATRAGAWYYSLLQMGGRLLGRGQTHTEAARQAATHQPDAAPRLVAPAPIPEPSPRKVDVPPPPAPEIKVATIYQAPEPVPARVLQIVDGPLGPVFADVVHRAVPVTDDGSTRSAG